MTTFPPLNTLRVFEAAARHLSFTRAGAELFVTHGAVSRQIQSLEAWLGTPLFRRYNRRLELTQAGATYLAEIGPALERLTQASLRLRDAQRVRVLRVNALATFTIRWLIPRLSSFQRVHPSIEVRLTTGNERLDRVRDPYDLAIRGGPDLYPGHRSAAFLGESRTPVASPALLDRLALASPRDLERHTLLHTETMPGAWPDWLARAGVIDLAPAAALTFEHFYLSVQAAVDGLGVAIGPSALVADDLAAGRLLAPFPDLALNARSYYWYCPESRAEDPDVALFRAWLEEASRAL